jgi:GH24 family phage-related lysozyme (muramidase)
MHISDAGLRFIESQEGFSSAPYWDPYGRVWTRGYGETEGIGPDSPHISKADAQASLRHRIETRYEWALRALGVDFDQVPGGQQKWDMLCSFAWNLGAGIFTGSLGHALRLKLWATAAKLMLEYDHAGGVVLEDLKRRRELEAAGLTATEQTGPYTPSDEARWEHEYDQLQHRAGPWPRLRRRVLRRTMTRRRKLIWQLAQHTGWGKLNREARYRALLVRTEA